MSDFRLVHDLDKLKRFVRKDLIVSFGEYVFLPEWDKHKNPIRCWIKFTNGEKQDCTETIQELSKILGAS